MTDYPALKGDVVTERHSEMCRVEGHSVHTVDGVPTGTCPRCGEVTEPVTDAQGNETADDDRDPITRGETYPDLCPVCGVHGGQSCVALRDGITEVPDHAGRGVATQTVTRM